ncbi:GntR family transcriptional regulator [Actinoplanes sp. NPDC051470]|uniref:GntR family transcriptional regulator n=1 Tax=unclassified Actinoplanes TaxID=2626549 RepID=UPI00341B7FA4
MSDGELASYSLVELALDRLSREILSGRVEPGERLVEEQLTRQLGISRGPLREALRLLAQQGLVEHIPRRGARVATLSDEDVRELYEIRDLLERHVASALPPVLDLAGLRGAVEVMRKATETGDRFATAEAHRRFHVEVVALSGNRQLTALFESILVRLQLYMAVNLAREAEAADAADGVLRHERLLAAVESGDQDAIKEALSRHGGRAFLAR